MNLKRLFLSILLIGLVTANLVVWVSFASGQKKELIVKVYDVGQGDSIFIRTPDNYKILVDGGPNNKVVDYLNKDLSLNDRSIDLMVLTHLQKDHMFGLIEVLKKIQVKKVLTSDITSTATEVKLWNDTLSNTHLKPDYVYAGKSITLSDQVTLKIVWPKDPKPDVTDLNHAALVMKLSYGNFDMLLTADAGMSDQPYTGTVNHVEVLKVPHHGSKTALREDFVKQLRPDVSVISVGSRNTYGHPTIELLDLLGKYSKKTYRTDQNGTIEFVSNGSTWYTQVEK